MARNNGHSGLQKNIRSIFQDAAMPDDIHITPAPVEPTPAPMPVVAPEPIEEPVAEAMPMQAQDACVSTPEAPVAEVQPETQAEPCVASEESKFSDPAIEAQMKKQKCEKHFSCYKSGLKDLCKARVIRGGKAVQCLEPKKKPCAYRLSGFFKRLCQCPIRIRIAKKHGK